MKHRNVAFILLIGLFVFFMAWSPGLSSAIGSKKPDEGRACDYEPPQSARDESDQKRGTAAEAQANTDEDGEEDEDPDLPSKFHGRVDKQTYLRMRDEFIALKRGIEPGRPFDPEARP